MTGDLNEFANFVFKAGQQPASWLRSAGHLRDAAEALINHELPAGRLYLQARQIADEEASAESIRSGTGVGTADIKALAPNYPPAQLLYAYAIENVLKGLIVLKQPDLIQERKLHDELTTHDLTDLAVKAEVTVDQQHERPCPRGPLPPVGRGRSLSGRSDTIPGHAGPERMAGLRFGPSDHADVLRARL